MNFAVKISGSVSKGEWYAPLRSSIMMPGTQTQRLEFQQPSWIAELPLKVEANNGKTRKKEFGFLLQQPNKLELTSRLLECVREI